MIKVLLLSANPIDSPLNIDEEFREIDKRIRSSEHRDHVNLIKHGAVRLDDVAGLLMRYKPHVVHFSGHGATAGIELTGQDGKGSPVPPAALANIFGALKDNVRVVLLNACDSSPQAEAIVSEIDCAVGMSDEIEDDAAIAFAAAFYEALGYGRSVKVAFDLALVQLEGTGADRSLAQLYERRTVKSSEIILVRGDSHSFSAALAAPSAPVLGSSETTSGKRKPPAAIRAQVASEQLKLVREVEMFFRRPVVMPRDLFGFPLTVEVNAAHMIAAYAKWRFQKPVLEELLKVDCPAGYLHPKALVWPLDAPVAVQTAAMPPPTPLSSWSDYFHWNVRLPSLCWAQNVRFRAFLEAPLLPAELNEPLGAVSKTLYQNTEAIRTAINECAQDMPRYFPDASSLDRIDLHWIHSRFNKYAESLSSAVAAVVAGLRVYYSSMV